MQQKEAELTETTDKLNSQVVGLQEELKDQEAEITMIVRASMANRFPLGKTEKKHFQSMVDDYLRFGWIKDLESEEEEKEETIDALASTTNSSSTSPPGDTEKEKDLAVEEA